ncbi:MAG: DNA alkylation repair protein [Clostridia bacterium]|nr:DNA alkylation repair protein [Clostridia bacterium]
MNYSQLLEELEKYSEPEFATGEKRIVNDPLLKFLGVRTPTLRKIIKKYKWNEELFNFPNEYYEVVFIKLAVVSEFPYEQFVSRLESLVPLITDWALCDSAMKPKCIKKHRENFIPYIKKYISMEGEFEQRFALITLLSFYVEDEWLSLIKECVEMCDSSKYYAMMGAAWLLAEVLVKHYEYGLTILNSTMCDIKVKNKAISKACDSYRITNEQKMYLKQLRAIFVKQTAKSID